MVTRWSFLAKNSPKNLYFPLETKTEPKKSKDLFGPLKLSEDLA
jgi:hypothetical protein